MIFREILKRETIKVSKGTGYTGGNYRVWLTLSCGDVIRRQGSKAPISRARCKACEMRNDILMMVAGK